MFQVSVFLLVLGGLHQFKTWFIWNTSEEKYLDFLHDSGNPHK